MSSPLLETVPAFIDVKPLILEYNACQPTGCTFWLPPSLSQAPLKSSPEKFSLCAVRENREKNPETVREEELLRGILKLILKRPIPICLLTLTKM